jgi:DNA-binding CsgD family transcriptional regulator/pimeloyl-ACP methyl ester carboxylesterase
MNPDASMIVGALYRVAADPTEWRYLLQALETAPPADHAEQAGLAAMVASGARVAELAAETGPSREIADTRAAVWIVSGDGRRMAANDDASASGLATLLNRDNPDQRSGGQELLRAARARLRASPGGSALISVTPEGSKLPIFAYVMALADLPAALRATLPDQLGPERGALAVVAPAVASDDTLWDGLTQSFGLTPAEARLTARLCDGASLKEAAEDLNVSVNTVRNQLTAVFEKTGVNRQSELVRALSDLRPLSRRIESRGIRPKRAWADLGVQPDAVRLPDGRKLVFREYGPPRGRPVMVFHGGLGAGFLPPGTDDACETLGLRLIVPDRPGVGGSDPHPNFSIAAVVDDLIWLTGDLGLGAMQYCSLTSGARFAQAMAAQAPGQVSRLLMLSPRPPMDPADAATSMESPMVALERRVTAHPWLAEQLFAIFRLRLSRPLVSQIMQASAVSPGDRAFLAAHPEAVDTITQAVTEHMRLTSRGASDEFRSPLAGSPGSFSPGAPPVTVWLGAEDAYVGEADLRRWLGAVLTDLWVVPDIGNYLILKHWSRALAWLAGANQESA